ncbi:hypothetical protein PVAND_010875 [Polypedilum vanderplanki]|uniref:Proteasome assembly chaperone 3 n=1 Tax=Polypedilum vanderplanki TaxID=319348 RepID=A0A9J6CHT9_POLVA|nr:hypothetical protein PVAND_010875 [Polypedilum vanderplanki]
MPTNNEAFEYLEAFEISGEHTEFVVQKFQNRTLIIITQFNKIGNFYTVKNQVFNDQNALASRSTQIFDIQQKFGPQSIEIEGAVRYLMNFIDTSHEILISLSLKNPEEIEKEILDKIKDVLTKISVLMK